MESECSDQSAHPLAVEGFFYSFKWHTVFNDFLSEKATLGSDFKGKQDEFNLHFLHISPKRTSHSEHNDHQTCSLFIRYEKTDI